MQLQELCDLLGSDPVFWFSALSGTGLFAIQFLLDLIGFNGQDEADDGGTGDAGKFKWLSKQAVTGFLMMFGWCGLTCKKQFDIPIPLTILLAISGGIVAVFIIGYIFRSARKLRSEGTVFRVEDAIGREAVVYHRIPRSGSGKVTVSLHNLTYEIDAISQNSEEISSFTQVQIIRKIDEKTVLVIPSRCL